MAVITLDTQYSQNIKQIELVHIDLSGRKKSSSTLLTNGERTGQMAVRLTTWLDEDSLKLEIMEY